jgi:23S rRNA pseudouridine1911/1915/1917 synthase
VTVTKPKNYNAASPAPAADAEIEFRLTADEAGLRLDQALARRLPQHSRARLQQWLREGRIRVSGREAVPKMKVLGGEAVSVAPVPPPEASANLPEAIALDVIHEDEAVLIVNKPPGLVVHPGAGNWSGTLMNALLHHCPALAGIPRAGIVHRLDKDTSGLLAIAKTLPAQTSLVRQLQARAVKREYVAVVHGRMRSAGRVAAPIGRDRRHRTRMAVASGGREAVTHFSILERYAHATLITCRLETGRTHQIRVHLTSLGHPLLGDATYGGHRRASTQVPPFDRQALHAERLALDHPVHGERVEWTAPPPADFAALLAALRDADKT